MQLTFWFPGRPFHSVWYRNATQVPKLVEKYKAEWNLKSLSVTYTTKRGYCFCIPVHDVDGLPMNAVQAVKKKTKVVFTTEELQFLNIRIRESLNTIFTTTADLVEVSVSNILSCVYLRLQRDCNPVFT